MIFYAPSDYQAKCHEQFVHFEKAIKHLIPEAHVEHIGASAIPNCVSKGDLDIFVGVDLDVFEDQVQKLQTLGFHEKKNTLRTDTLCMLEADDKNSDVALQVVANDSEMLDFLGFRNALLENPDLVLQYNALKQSCSGWDEDNYREKKAQFIASVLNG